MTRVLRWNGRDLPEELRSLPPGEYVIGSVEVADALDDEEQEGLEEALDAVERGETISADEAFRARDAPTTP